MAVVRAVGSDLRYGEGFGQVEQSGDKCFGVAGMLTQFPWSQTAVVEVAVQLAHGDETLLQRRRTPVQSIQMPYDGAPAQRAVRRYDSMLKVNRQNNPVDRAPQHFAAGDGLTALGQFMGKLP